MEYMSTHDFPGYAHMAIIDPVDMEKVWEWQGNLEPQEFIGYGESMSIRTCGYVC